MVLARVAYCSKPRSSSSVDTLPSSPGSPRPAKPSCEHPLPTPLPPWCPDTYPSAKARMVGGLVWGWVWGLGLGHFLGKFEIGVVCGEVWT